MMLLLWLQTITNENERNAIEQIFNLYYPKMKYITYEILHNLQDAEDAAMNAIKYMCVHPDLFVEYDSPKTLNLIWLCAKSSAIDIYRYNKRKNKLFVSFDNDENKDEIESMPDLSASTLDILISQENKNMLAKAIESLDEMYQIPILLKYNHQMKNIEIAEMLHIDVNTVNGRIFRAKKLLQQKMKELGYQI